MGGGRVECLKPNFPNPTGLVTDQMRLASPDSIVGNSTLLWPICIVTIDLLTKNRPTGVVFRLVYRLSGGRRGHEIRFRIRQFFPVHLVHLFDCFNVYIIIGEVEKKLR